MPAFTRFAQWFVLIGLLFATSKAFATANNFTGTINAISTQDSQIIGANTDFVTVNGFTSSGTCQTNSGLVLMRIRADTQGRGQLSMLLAAMLAGKQVTVSVDDNYRDSSGYCYLRFSKLN